MEDDDDIANLTQFSNLIAKHPDLDMTLIADVLQQCGQDHVKALNILTEMVSTPNNHTIPQVQPQPNSFASSPSLQTTSLHTQSNTSTINQHFAPEYGVIFETTPTQQSPPPKLSSHQNHVSSKPKLRGAWANKSMGRKYRVDQMCNRYQWMDRAVVETLFEQYGDCVQLVEQDILQMFPVDQPEAFQGETISTTPARHISQSQQLHNGHSSTPSQSLRHKAIAESLRQQAAAEIHRDSLRPQDISASSRNVTRLRNQLWETREHRLKLQQVANLTRKPEHIAEAQQQDAHIRHLSTSFLKLLRSSQEYKNGFIDLHGLTKEEALQLINWKLNDNGRRRFRVVTGKGIHSHNGQAVLRPALEKYFREKGISFSEYEDGVITVIP